MKTGVASKTTIIKPEQLQDLGYALALDSATGDYQMEAVQTEEEHLYQEHSEDSDV